MKTVPQNRGKRREAQHCVHTVDVHVRNPRFRVVAARNHVVVAHRFDAVLLGFLAGDGVQADVRIGPTLVNPHLHWRFAVDWELFDLRGPVLIFLRQSVCPHAGVLDQVIVNGQKLHPRLERHS
jgi:hypothetical protein